MTTSRSTSVAVLSALAALLALVVSGIAPANSAVLPSRTATTDPTVVPTLIDVRAAHHPGYDRVIFQFAGGVPSTRAGYVDKLVADASGKTVRIAGRAILRVVFTGADAHTQAGPTVPVRTAYDLPNVLTTVRAGDFEAVTSYGIGLARQTAVHVITDRPGNRVLVDVRADFATVSRGVWFADTAAFVANTPPFATAVLRPLRADQRLIAALDRLFAGPLPSEQALGLRFVRSHARNFADLRVSDGVARVRLTGGCNSNGSTLTIADEIMPTLKQFAGVTWVKIYGPGGYTENPTGHSDSIPFCLEP